MDKKKRFRKPLSAAQRLAIEQRTFRGRITRIFTSMGFHYFPTLNHELKVGLRKVELDYLFVYENVWLICEDTISKSDIKDHIRKKNEASAQIQENFSDFFSIINGLFPDSNEFLNKYDESLIQLFFLYIPKYEPDLDKSDIELFNSLVFVMPNTLRYFHWISGCIKRTSRHELFRFLKLDEGKIGYLNNSAEIKTIQAPIIYPKEFTGRKDKVRIVSFMMSAEDLMNSAYVLRKDNWDRSIYLYQRLINKDKINKIRSYVEQKGEAFYNNVIVALPSDVSIKDGNNAYYNINSISSFPEKCDLLIPKRANSICIIDGQHRVFAHYESGTESAQEKKISVLRKQLHLLVTGLVFDKDMSEAEIVKAQSEIFLDINSNASPVPPSVLLQIKRIMDPIGNESLAQLTIEKVNSLSTFNKLFQLSELGEGIIKTASIVRFALKNLVSINPNEDKRSLYNYWDGDKEALLKADENAIGDYTMFCAKKLNEYFAALKKRFKNEWADENSRILSVVSVNGFIIALTRQLKTNGIKDFDYYDSLFNKWNYDFSKESFVYTSSQYRKFSTEILRQVFKIEE